MNYRKTYFNIIRKALSRSRCPSNFCEKHHIIPKSIIKNNFIVSLTTKEHFLCHKLLYKYFSKRHGNLHPRTTKSLVAFFFLSNRLNIKRSRDYEKIRNKYIEHLRNKRKTIRTFYHDKYGKFTGTIEELCEKYPELTSSLLYLVSSGKRTHHKGWCKDLETSKKVSNKTHLKRTKYKFIHKVYGVYEGSIFEMKKIYKDMNLDDSYLRAVHNGKRNQHRGWRRIDFKEKKIKWYHENYGIVEAKITELSNLYPNLKLNKAHLSRVNSGKLKQHKGWRILE